MQRLGSDIANTTSVPEYDPPSSWCWCISAEDGRENEERIPEGDTVTRDRQAFKILRQGEDAISISFLESYLLSTWHVQMTHTSVKHFKHQGKRCFILKGDR